MMNQRCKQKLSFRQEPSLCYKSLCYNRKQCISCHMSSMLTLSVLKQFCTTVACHQPPPPHKRVVTVHVNCSLIVYKLICLNQQNFQHLKCHAIFNIQSSVASNPNGTLDLISLFLLYTLSRGDKACLFIFFGF